MAEKDAEKTESSSSAASTVSKKTRSSHNSSVHMNESDEESDHSSERESGSLRSSLVNTLATIQNNIFKKGKPLEAWHQFLLSKIIYNKDYTYMDKAFRFMECKTMVRREQIFYAGLFLLVAFVLLQNFDPLLCTTVSCIYPAYETTRSLTIHKNKARKQREHWLIYWIVFSFFTLQDYHSEWLTMLLSPFLLLKMLFLMLLALPQTGMAELCYYNIVVPMLSVINDTFVKYNRVCFLLLNETVKKI
ncbi:hypothetical protein LOAG_00049 [Loa loa]|uniref:Receptor expression-enhancing protein n=1 Tax=Loa loa TaxID=7209 RepID=A0A1S0UCQ7_LOALO|nr:hypothetical protein LOAG_00049 [Loa loa]EFO28453.1 hypothetical protein LOAG_00049 [Loa loa]